MLSMILLGGLALFFFCVVLYWSFSGGENMFCWGMTLLCLPIFLLGRMNIPPEACIFILVIIMLCLALAITIIIKFIDNIFIPCWNWCCKKFDRQDLLIKEKIDDGIRRKDDYWY